MTKEEGIIISAYTGYMLTSDFHDVHRFIEDLLGRPVWTHQLVEEKVLAEIRHRAKPLIQKIIAEQQPGNVSFEKYIPQKVAAPLTTQELRGMNDQTVYCLELNTEVRVSARKTGWIEVHWPLPNEKDCCKAHGLTLFRTRPAEVK